MAAVHGVQALALASPFSLTQVVTEDGYSACHHVSRVLPRYGGPPRGSRTLLPLSNLSAGGAPCCSSSFEPGRVRRVAYLVSLVYARQLWTVHKLA
jgi:hypothetical protein